MLLMASSADIQRTYDQLLYCLRSLGEYRRASWHSLYRAHSGNLPAENHTTYGRVRSTSASNTSDEGSIQTITVTR